MKRLRLRLLVTAASLGIMSMAPGLLAAPKASHAASMTPITLRLPWVVNTQFAGPFAALDKGFWAKRGLAVTIEPGGINKNSITLVAGGSGQFGLHDVESLLLARSQGIPVVAVSTIFQEHPGGAMVLASSHITKPQDFIGKKIGYQIGGPQILLKAMLAKYGVPADKVQWVSIGYSIAPTLTHQVDMQTVYATDEPLLAQQQHAAVRTILPYDFGVKTSADTLFTTSSYAQAHPAVVKAMVAGLIEGWALGAVAPPAGHDHRHAAWSTIEPALPVGGAAG